MLHREGRRTILLLGQLQACRGVPSHRPPMEGQEAALSGAGDAKPAAKRAMRAIIVVLAFIFGD